jgi:hypothetical protein
MSTKQQLFFVFQHPDLDTLIRDSFDIDLLESAGAYANIDDAEEFLDDVMENIDARVAAILSTYIETSGHRNSYARDTRFGSMEAEFTFGVGESHNDAKIAYVDALCGNTTWE